MKGVGGTGKQVGKNVGRKGAFPRASNDPESSAPRMTGLGFGGWVRPSKQAQIKVCVSLVNGRPGRGQEVPQLKAFVTGSWCELRGTHSATACEIRPPTQGSLQDVLSESEIKGLRFHTSLRGGLPAGPSTGYLIKILSLQSASSRHEADRIILSWCLWAVFFQTE